MASLLVLLTYNCPQVDFTFDGCHDLTSMASIFTNHASSYALFPPDSDAALQMFMPSSASSTQGYPLVDGTSDKDVFCLK